VANIFLTYKTAFLILLSTKRKFLSIKSMINLGDVTEEGDSIHRDGLTDVWLKCCDTIYKQGCKDGENKHHLIVSGEIGLLNSVPIII